MIAAASALSFVATPVISSIFPGSSATTCLLARVVRPRLLHLCIHVVKASGTHDGLGRRIRDAIRDLLLCSVDLPNDPHEGLFVPRDIGAGVSGSRGHAPAALVHLAFALGVLGLALVVLSLVLLSLGGLLRARRLGADKLFLTHRHLLSVLVCSGLKPFAFFLPPDGRGLLLLEVGLGLKQNLSLQLNLRDLIRRGRDGLWRDRVIRRRQGRAVEERRCGGC